MNAWASSAFFCLAVAACGGTIGPGDGDAATTDAAADGIALDAGPDAAYAACIDSSGQVDSSLKTCQSDGDCVIEEEQTDCCGTILYVGIRASAVSAFATCEAAWVDHFPGCGCASGAKKTEDGTVTGPGADAAAPAVHCGDFTSNGGICLTYTP